MKIRKRIIGVALSVAMLFGSANSLYALTEDYGSMGSAIPVTYEQSVHVALDSNTSGAWYKFTPTRTMAYTVSSSNLQTDSDSLKNFDPQIKIYTEDQRLIGSDDDSGEGRNFSTENVLYAGTTYYFWVTKYDQSQAGSIDFVVTWGFAASITVNGNTNFGRSVNIEMATENDITLNIECSQPMSYQWYRYSYITGIYEKLQDEISSSLHVTVPGDKFRVEVSSGTSIIRTFDFRIVSRDHRPEFTDNVFFSFTDAGQETSITVPETTGTLYPVNYRTAYRYDRWYYDNFYQPYSGDIGSWSSSRTLPVPGYTVTTMDYIEATQEYIEATYAENYYLGLDGLLIPYIAFVKSESNCITLVSDETQEISLDAIVYDGTSYPGLIYNKFMWPDCKVGTFTPSESGTYTLCSSDISSGDPFVALFDSDHNLIATADNMDGSSFFDEEDEYPAYADDYNFSLTSHLDAGQTYYFVIWSAEYRTGNNIQGTLAQFNVTLTCDEVDAIPENTTEEGSEPSSETPASTEPTASEPSGSSALEGEVSSDPAPSSVIPSNPNPTTTETGVAGFVERLYTIALGRASDPAGKQDWIDAITIRGESGADCARGFLFSPEFLNKQCTNEEFTATLYRTFFNREPDQAGFDGWVNALNNGASKQDVIEGFINSTEWANLCVFYGIRSGSTAVPTTNIDPNEQTIAFATRLYTTCLGRNADQEGLMAWARQLANQRDTGSGAARGFFFSSEFTGQNVSNGEFVTRLYRTFMDREPDQAGYDAWVAQLDGGVSRETVFEGFAQSPEFTRICAAYGIIR